jgi:hypothetical protein
MSAIADFFSTYLTTYTAFTKPFSTDHLRYGLMSNLVMAVHCDGDLLQYALSDRFKTDYNTICGPICTALLQEFDSPVQTAYRVNPMDHTQVVVFASNATEGIPITGIGGALTKVFVAFRGTQYFDLINNRRNLNFVFWPVTMCTGCEAHKGFWRNFISLRPEIQPIIDSMGASMSAIDGTSTTFLCTGMSMGAPLASLAAYHLSNLGHTANGIVTFGSPRVGNLKLAEAITGAYLDKGVGTIGIAYMRDPVPHVPPRMLGFRSAQALLFHISIHPSAMVYSEIGTGDIVDLEDSVYYAGSYESSLTNAWSGDKKFASATYTYKLTDHFGYFIGAQMDHMISCGTMSEDFIKNDKATELFFQ